MSVRVFMAVDRICLIYEVTSKLPKKNNCLNVSNRWGKRRVSSVSVDGD